MIHSRMMKWYEKEMNLHKFEFTSQDSRKFPNNVSHVFFLITNTCAFLFKYMRCLMTALQDVSSNFHGARAWDFVGVSEPAELEKDFP